MQYYIVEFSKYAIALLMGIYTLEAFLALGKKRNDENKSVYVRQDVYIFVIQFLAYLSMCLQTGQIEYLFFYAFLQIALFSTIVLYQMIYPKCNRLIVNNMCLLLSIGFIMLTRLHKSIHNGGTRCVARDVERRAYHIKDTVEGVEQRQTFERYARRNQHRSSQQRRARNTRLTYRAERTYYRDRDVVSHCQLDAVELRKE